MMENIIPVFLMVITAASGLFIEKKRLWIWFPLMVIVIIAIEIWSKGLR